MILPKPVKQKKTPPQRLQGPKRNIHGLRFEVAFGGDPGGDVRHLLQGRRH